MEEKRHVIWNVTMTSMHNFDTRVDIWDHELKVFTFTSEQRAKDYLEFLQELDACYRQEEGYDEDNKSRWCIRRHFLNPGLDNADDEHYDKDSLKEQKAKKRRVDE